jgi:exopolysaccharide biosynthesis predicted pyruvyltransferase EpsI
MLKDIADGVKIGEKIKSNPYWDYFSENTIETWKNYLSFKNKKKFEKRNKKIKKDKNMDVVKIADIKEKKYYIEGPREFINYFEDAEIVLTDSFHGAIFSILFEKPFVIYDRIGGFSSMNSRINTLLNKFNFESRLAEKINEKDIFTIDFSHVESILEKERKKSIKYLKKALNIHDET